MAVKKSGKLWKIVKKSDKKSGKWKSPNTNQPTICWEEELFENFLHADDEKTCVIVSENLFSDAFANL